MKPKIVSLKNIQIGPPYCFKPLLYVFQHPMTDHERSILRKWQTGDNILYQHFVSKFKKQIGTFGLSRMEKDLARLKEIRKENLGINDFLEGQLSDWSETVVWSGTCQVKWKSSNLSDSKKIVPNSIKLTNLDFGCCGSNVQGALNCWFWTFFMSIAIDIGEKLKRKQTLCHAKFLLHDDNDNVFKSHKTVHKYATSGGGWQNPV